MGMPSHANGERVQTDVSTPQTEVTHVCPPYMHKHANGEEYIDVSTPQTEEVTHVCPPYMYRYMPPHVKT